MEKVLKRGHVPLRHRVYVERKAMIQKIQEELRKLKDEDGYFAYMQYLYIYRWAIPFNSCVPPMD